ncbi:MAG: chromosomal replication initiator protein DnaA [Bacteroidales bacterium]|jgi:chromosomal replication initiator protein|nr:chromosomal replication initiator protein DnaA [Bacteroidales bacterium]
MMDSKSKDCKEVWSRCLAIIKANIEPEAYKTWFEPIVPIAIQDNTLIIRLPSHLYYEWLEQNYVSLLKLVIRKELGASGKLQYRVIMEKTQEDDKTISLPSRDGYAVNNIVDKQPIDIFNVSEKNLPDPFVLPGIKKHKISSNLIESFNFDNYVEGDCNRLARSAGWAIAREPGETAFNPFFIYSDVGLGKTHLAHAIGLQTKVNHPDKTVLYVNSDLFYQQFMEAVKNGNINDFIYFYQSVDVLIIDDIQYLAGGKLKTQEAFFHIFNSLYMKGKQIILTSDKSPVEISGFEARLLSRFKWGLTADLTIPDYETRIAIINKKLEHNGIEFPCDVIEYLALRVTSNTRELEGAMISILAQASLNRKEITVELAKEMVDKFVKSTAKEISIEFIQKIICDYYSVPVESINANTRKREVAQARQLCMFFAKKFTKMPLAAIGELCGKKHHATVLHACRTMHNLYETDKKMKKEMDDIEKKLKT